MSTSPVFEMFLDSCIDIFGIANGEFNPMRHLRRVFASRTGALLKILDNAPIDFRLFATNAAYGIAVFTRKLRTMWYEGRDDDRNGPRM